MDQIGDAESDTVQNEFDCSKYSETLKVSGTTDTNISSQDDLKIKVEIEFKEEENGLVYQPDFYGHLRLVSLNQGTPSECSTIKNKTDMREWQYFQSPLSTLEMNESTALPDGENNFHDEYIYEQLNNIYGISEEIENSNFQSSLITASTIYNSSDIDSLPQQFSESSQNNRKKKELSYILAEKKRNYRNRIKEENPTMWYAMKQKDACKKREQREEKKFILLEMQKMMQLTSLPDSPDQKNHKMYLEALKERYPDIWRQLIDALSAAEQRNNEFLDRANPKRRASKPIKMYKDVVEAQKKYLYRQRLKLERPDLYEQQKARDSYARSIRRMLKKKLAESQNNLNS